MDTPISMAPSSVRSGLAVLNRISDLDIDWILDSGIETEVAPGEVIVNEGTRPGAIFLVASGLLHVFLGGDAGARLATLGPGQLVGEMSFLEGRPASASVAAIEPSIIISLPHSLLKAKLESDYGFAARLYRSLAQLGSQRLRELLNDFRRQVQDEPPLSLTASASAHELAAATQRCKEAMIAAERETEVPVAGDRLIQALLELAGIMNRTAGPDSEETPDFRDELGARVQQELLPFLLRSELAERLYRKPRGYEFDFQTMGLIAGEPGLRSADCPLTESLRQLPSLAGLRNRERLMGDILREQAEGRPGEPLRCTLLADHAGRLAFSVLAGADDPKAFETVVLDFDGKALERIAHRAAVAGFVDPCVCTLAHLLSLTTGRFEPGGGNRHVICSDRLADTLEDHFLLRIIDRAYDLLAPGGCLLLGFCAEGSPDSGLLRYALGVSLFRRTERDVNQLLSRSRFGCPATRVRYEEEHAGFVAECVKPATSVV